MTAGAVRKIFVAIPVYSHDLDFKTFISLTQAAAEGAQYNFKLQVQFRVGNAMVHKARNMLLSEFLATDCTDLFFVDSDISWGAGTFGRMVTHPVDFVCGCYRSKSEGGALFCQTGGRRVPPKSRSRPRRGGSGARRIHARLAQSHRGHDRAW